MTIYDWHVKLAEGKAGEEAVKQWLDDHFATDGFVSDVRDEPDYQRIDTDFIHTSEAGVRTFYEVKTDLKAHETGNLFLEFEALEKSQADYWLIFIPQRGWLFQFNRANLQKLAKENFADTRTVHSIVKDGSRWTATGVPIRMSELLLHLQATLYTGITTEAA